MMRTQDLEDYYYNSGQIDCFKLDAWLKKKIFFKMNAKFIILKDIEYETKHYNIKSKDPNLSEEKKFNFDVWYDEKNNIIIKIAYTKMGKWEYRLKNFE